MTSLARRLRPLLVSSLALALWAIALPARASSAPFCDDRGASALAPPPTLVGAGTDAGTQLGRLDLPCDAEEDFIGATLTRGHPAPVPTAEAPPPYLAPPSFAVVPATGEDLDRPPSEAPRADGVRSRIERPPRS
ncbi:MAG: hypothetical protein ACRELB_10440 [Polyangiaceae bacterium]